MCATSPTLRRRPRPLLAAAVAAVSLHLSAAPEPAVDAAPVLVTTEEQGWTSLEELQEAAEAGHGEAAFQYAQLLEHGDQVKADPQRALTFYRRAAEAGVPAAQFRLGKIQHDGLLGTSVDYQASLALYQRAALGGIPEAMYNIGAMYVSGRGVKRDYVEGLAWLLVAAEHGAEAQPGIDQVRRRLAKRPEQIGAAEQRAQRLGRQLEEGNLDEAPAGPAQGRPVVTPPPVAPTLPQRTPVQIERPPAAVLPPLTLPAGQLDPLESPPAQRPPGGETNKKDASR